MRAMSDDKRQRSSPRGPAGSGSNRSDRRGQGPTGRAAGRAKPRDREEPDVAAKRAVVRAARFVPKQPKTLEDLGFDEGILRELVLRYLGQARAASGRAIAEAVACPLSVVKTILEDLKYRKYLNYRATTALGDFICELGETGKRLAAELTEQTAYIGTAPVPWEQYLVAVPNQRLRDVRPGPADLKRAFADLSVPASVFDQLGPALVSAKALFLFGEPGNGKTSLAERITGCFGDAVWIPRTILIRGFLVKLFDPEIHKEVTEGLPERFDGRWVCIERPTVVAGGELTLDMLDMRYDASTNMCEPPLQLKANFGTLLIDDFGRGATAPQDLLNRWIYPLEKRADFLRLPDGGKILCPFEALLAFSTNLEPRDLVDEAFLRRIPYKIHVQDPDVASYAKLMRLLAGKMGVRITSESLKYLVEEHYVRQQRPMRYCHPRDLLQQVVDICAYEGRRAEATAKEWDRVVSNYFAVAD
jgi:predicted ATPase with chaperone activity